MDIFEELFGNVLSEDDVREMVFLRNNGMLKKISYKGNTNLVPNAKQIKVFTSVLSDIYKLAQIDDDIHVFPPDITPDIDYRIKAEVPISIGFSGESKDILQRVLPHVSTFGVGIKEEELKKSYEGDVETLTLNFVIPDVYTYPYEEVH